MIPMESSVVIVVGITVTLLSLLVKFQPIKIESECVVELRVIEQTSSSFSPIIPCLTSLGFKKILGV